MSVPRESRLGWLQQYVLTLLWNHEMYGLEIQRKLKFRGENVSTSQLYPALNKLEELGAIKSRIKVRVGADRKYYSIADVGKKLLLENLRGLLNFFEVMGIENLRELYDYAMQLRQVQPEDNVVDFSNPYLEEIRMENASKLGSGAYHVVSHKPEETKTLVEWASFEELERVNVIGLVDGEIPIPDNSIDLAIAFSILHEDGTDWIITESARVLKTGGSLLIADLVAIEDNWREKIIPQFVDNVSHTGLVRDALIENLVSNGFTIREMKEDLGFLLLLSEKI